MDRGISTAPRTAAESSERAVLSRAVLPDAELFSSCRLQPVDGLRPFCTNSLEPPAMALILTDRWFGTSRGIFTAPPAAAALTILARCTSSLLQLVAGRKA